MSKLDSKTSSNNRDAFASDSEVPSSVSTKSKSNKKTSAQKTMQTSNTETALRSPKVIRKVSNRLRVSELVAAENERKLLEQQQVQAILTPIRIAHQKDLDQLQSMNSSMIDAMSKLDDRDKAEDMSKSSPTTDTNCDNVTDEPEVHVANKSRRSPTDRRAPKKPHSPVVCVEPQESLTREDFWNKQTREDFEDGHSSLACITCTGNVYYSLPFYTSEQRYQLF